MKRTTKLNTLASEVRGDARRPEASTAPSQKGQRKQGDTVIILNDRLMPYSRARSTSCAEERHLILISVRAALQPQTILEDHACELVADQIMQLRMLDRFRGLVLERTRGEAVTNLLVGRIENAYGHVVAMLRGDEAARAIVEDALAAFDIPEEAIEAEAFMISIDEVERLSRLSAQAQIRLDLQLKQIERRRPVIAAEIKALAHAEIDTQAQDEDHAGFAPDLPKPNQDRDQDKNQEQDQDQEHDQDQEQDQAQVEFDRLAHNHVEANGDRRAFEEDGEKII